MYCFRPIISHFSQEPYFLLFENRIRNQDLGQGFVHCYWDLFASEASWLKEQEVICMCTDLSVDIDRFIFIYIIYIIYNLYIYRYIISICVYINLNISSCWRLQPQSITTRIVLTSSPCLSVIFRRVGRTLALIILCLFTHCLISFYLHSCILNPSVFF